MTKHILPQITLTEEEFEHLNQVADALNMPVYEAVRHVIRTAPLPDGFPIRRVRGGLPIDVLAPNLETKSDAAELEG